MRAEAVKIVNEHGEVRWVAVVRDGRARSGTLRDYVYGHNVDLDDEREMLELNAENPNYNDAVHFRSERKALKKAQRWVSATWEKAS